MTVPHKQEYSSVQIDEVWSFVGRKNNKHWLLYAYALETKEVLAFVCGSRSRTTVRRLYKHLSGLTIGSYDTDHWKAFKTVFPEDRHCIGKEYTKHVEGVNTSRRARNKHFVRRTIRFSPSKEHHEYSLNLYCS
jgi:insertion element IS1 protein InsB